MHIPSVPGLQFFLRVDGVNLTEYDDVEDEGATSTKNPSVTKYVEATPRSKFAVRISADPRLRVGAPECIKVAIHLDGKRVYSPIVRASRFRSGYTVNWEGVDYNVDSRKMLAAFTFAELELRDGSATEVKPEDVKHLGEVEVKCYWVVETSKPYPARPRPAVPSTNTEVLEKALKGRALSLGTKLRDAEFCEGDLPASVHVSYSRGKTPFASFKFKYRTRNDLQVEGVIPRSPSPIPLEERDLDSLTLEESRELVRRSRAREAELAKVKQEKRTRSATFVSGGDDEDDVEVAVVKSKKRQRLHGDPGIETVDLTEC